MVETKWFEKGNSRNDYCCIRTGTNNKKQQKSNC